MTTQSGKGEGTIQTGLSLIPNLTCKLLGYEGRFFFNLHLKMNRQHSMNHFWSVFLSFHTHLGAPAVCAAAALAVWARKHSAASSVCFPDPLSSFLLPAWCSEMLIPTHCSNRFPCLLAFCWAQPMGRHEQEIRGREEGETGGFIPLASSLPEGSSLHPGLKPQLSLGGPSPLPVQALGTKVSLLAGCRVLLDPCVFLALCPLAFK